MVSRMSTLEYMSQMVIFGLLTGDWQGNGWKIMGYLWEMVGTWENGKEMLADWWENAL